MNGFMKMALDCASENLKLTDGKRDGGPFGVVIVRDGKVISKSHNLVNKHRDPTMHAEIVAIREATAKLKKRYLDDCEIYCSCFPCPMCLGAIYWAKIPAVYFGSTSLDSTVNHDTDDSMAYNEIVSVIESVQKRNGFTYTASTDSKIQFINIDRNECNVLMSRWSKRERI